MNYLRAAIERLSVTLTFYFEADVAGNRPDGSLVEWDGTFGSIVAEVVGGKLEITYGVNDEISRTLSKDIIREDILHELEDDVIPIIEDEHGIKVTNLHEAV